MWRLNLTKTHKIILLSILLVQVIVFAVWLYLKPSGTSSLGNRLSEYFYYTHTTVASDEKLLKEQERNANNKDPELRIFYKKLDWTRQSTFVDYQSLPRSAWSQRGDQGQNKSNYLAYWQHIRPLAHKIYHKNIASLPINEPVIHFRCSDVPFSRTASYHLTKAISVQWMAEKIKERGFSKVIFLSCNKHLTKDDNSCIKYIDFYIKLFAEHGLQVEQQCNSAYHDFALMVYTPLLVSLNASSFSFMAGVSKQPQDYISCNMGVETPNEYLLQTEADWILDKNSPLLHKDVVDYYDVDDVIEKLKK